MLKDFLCVAVGGAVGSTLRYGITMLAAYLQCTSTAATLATNILGSALMGFILIITTNDSIFLLTTVGLCGGFTTFSTFSAQTLTMWESGQYGWAIGYALLSVVSSVLAVAAGAFLGKMIAAR